MESLVGSAREVFSRTPKVLGALVADLPDEWLHGHDAADAWSPYQMCGHLLHVEECEGIDRTRVRLEHGATRLLVLLPATRIHSELGATALLAGVATVFAICKCVHAIVLGPLVADLAPAHLLGRDISMYSLMVSGGFALGPAIGGAVPATSPDAVWWGGALVAATLVVRASH